MRVSGPRSLAASTCTRAVRTCGASGSLGAACGKGALRSVEMPGFTDVEATWILSFEGVADRAGWVWPTRWHNRLQTVNSLKSNVCCLDIDGYTERDVGREMHLWLTDQETRGRAPWTPTAPGTARRARRSPTTCSRCCASASPPACCN